MTNGQPADEIRLRIEGSRIHGISDLYTELNRVFMANESWQLGESLDALDDLLYGGYGTVPTDSNATIVWADHAHTQAALGVEATRAYYLAKLARPEQFNEALFREKLADLDAGTGQTYFEIVAEIFASHPRFTVLWE